ncbi:protein mizu-kussei 1 [Phtheirospermum japonicum]|uniref:Protein mizu-kussei 1 n=1 Tax=Phtheirospermum japonicum TaxID=374723 RepID=A0A830C8P8_9LAMI|nr:protein mizu-kussei 1 [Phtheirospermum japonicum]
MAKNPQDSSSFSRRYFHWKKKVAGHEDEDEKTEQILEKEKTKKLEVQLKNLPMQQNSSSSSGFTKAPTKKFSVMAVSKLRSGLLLGRARARSHFSSGLGSKVVGTLFGQRRGHVHFAIQEDFKLGPAFLVELATPTSVLVKEMASGLVRIALECDKRPEKKGSKLLEEPVWRTYCNGKKCGFAMRRECGPDEWKVLNAIGPISMGAGVLPGLPGAESDGEMMYMRAKFERVVGSKDSEAFYMMNPDGNGGPELSIYLLRV